MQLQNAMGLLTKDLHIDAHTVVAVRFANVLPAMCHINRFNR